MLYIHVGLPEDKSSILEHNPAAGWCSFLNIYVIYVTNKNMCSKSAETVHSSAFGETSRTLARHHQERWTSENQIPHAGHDSIHGSWISSGNKTWQHMATGIPPKNGWVLNWLTSSINDSLSIALFDGTRSYLTKTYNTVYSMANSPLIAKQQTLPARLCTPSYKWVIIPLTIVRYITNKNQPVKLDQHWHRTNQSRDLAHWGTTLWGPGEKPAMFLQHWVPLRSTNRIICELDPSTSPGAKSGRDLPGVTKKISPSFFLEPQNDLVWGV